jgi:RNA polymerase sigma factor (TIGR02999 family)
MADVTQILARIDDGDASAAEELLPLVYDELRRLAERQMAGEKPGHTLNATALVHEAYLRLAGTTRPQRWDGHGHFFAAAAESMRRILVERARRKRRLRHGGDLQRVALDEAALLGRADSDDDVLGIHEALEDLEAIDPDAARLVKLRYFLGLSFTQTAKMLGISERTAYRTWSYARAWLYAHLQEVPPAG